MVNIVHLTINIYQSLVKIKQPALHKPIDASKTLSECKLGTRPASAALSDLSQQSFMFKRGRARVVINGILLSGKEKGGKQGKAFAFDHCRANYSIRCPDKALHHL